MGRGIRHTDTHAGRIWKRAGQQGTDARWRTVQPSADVQEALADFRDLCFRPPDDPHEQNAGRLGCNSPVAGEALVALEPLYDRDRMRQAMDSGHFRDGVDVVRHALAALLHMQDDPDHHLYKPLTETMPPAREPGIVLETVLSRLLDAVQRDFQPEIESIKRENSGRTR